MGVPVIHFDLTPRSRKAIEAEIERLISLLDAADGDCDLEDGDPAGDNVEDCPQEEDWRPEGFMLPWPVFGVDQSAGPINEREVDRVWRRHLMAG